MFRRARRPKLRPRASRHPSKRHENLKTRPGSTSTILQGRGTQNLLIDKGYLIHRAICSNSPSSRCRMPSKRQDNVTDLRFAVTRFGSFAESLHLVLCANGHLCPPRKLYFCFRSFLLRSQTCQYLVNISKCNQSATATALACKSQLYFECKRYRNCSFCKNLGYVEFMKIN